MYFYVNLGRIIFKFEVLNGQIWGSLSIQIFKNFFNDFDVLIKFVKFFGFGKKLFIF